jgi:pyruvate dehydrogenase E2 component (dihydrolipoyllysine-residue acetyltransferase)
MSLVENAVDSADRMEKLDYASRWMRDGLEAVSTRAGFFICVHVDVSGVQNIIDAYRHLGKRITYTHVAVKVCADLLARSPAHHKFVADNQELHPARVDIGLAVAADQPLAPILVVKAADRKTLVAISEEVERRAPEVRKQFAEAISQWKKWGWLVPFSFLRRPLLRMAAGGVHARRKAAGTFQITNLPEADIFVPLLLGGVSALGMGRVSERVVPREGRIVIRPMITLTYSVDHAVFDGRMAASFLSDLKQALESCDATLGLP